MIALLIGVGVAIGLGTVAIAAWVLRAALNEERADEVTIAWRDAHEREQGRHD